MKFLLILLSVSVSACSSYHYAGPESIGEKMDRYKSKNPNPNPVPDLSAKNDLIRKNENQAREEVQAPTLSKVTYSNKRLYFLGLLKQYDQFKAYSQKDQSSIKACPQFHTATSDYLSQKKNTSKVKLKSAPLKNGKVDPLLYPEYYLPFNNRPAYELASAKNSTKVLSKAIEEHITRTYREIQELCEYGSSDNYYAFENLITHIQSTGIYKNADGAKILLKTPLFSNDLILTSLKARTKTRSRGLASGSSTQSDPLIKELSSRLGVSWFHHYTYNLKKER